MQLFFPHSSFSSGVRRSPFEVFECCLRLLQGSPMERRLLLRLRLVGLRQFSDLRMVLRPDEGHLAPPEDH